MKTRMLLVGGLSALVMGGSVVGCTAEGGRGGIASANTRSATVDARAAADNATRATRALARHDGAAAVPLAESAVALVPRNAGYRLLLGQSYLEAGRFVSARTALTDALALDPANGRVALNLALAQIATGDWAAARATLTANQATVPASDRGLALALAGDPAGGVTILTDVVRSPQTSPKARQNLALALALAGQWAAARVVASADMAPAEVDQRIEQWAAFAQPSNASDQVASLLGVHAIGDAGQPVALALNAVVSPAVAVAAADTAVTAIPPQPVATVTPAAAARPVEVAGVAFGPRREVVQSLAPALIRSDAGPTKVALAAAPVRGAERRPAATTGGAWVVQIGAFGSADVARDAWARATRRLPVLAQHGPSAMTFRARGDQFYRLSVGGFDRADADELCRRYRASGGVCFVRGNAGDRVAQWARPTETQLASRG
ncbi:Tetratricopeptide repeat-containing protein [Sphingomonas gellani]|uniref:Tetratricopeptide repeat-containing protein n=1 Tax=Sphingomonas gellani TaxID=1166340 RepID=A0A1H7Y667_9SPHN|nr:SPOR domain-containing protein [Sphingomonas gellani]SEM41630.1 Tetratricopeptide repeat-containing protein [Sphingomonas gellani]